MDTHSGFPMGMSATRAQDPCVGGQPPEEVEGLWLHLWKMPDQHKSRRCRLWSLLRACLARTNPAVHGHLHLPWGPPRWWGTINRSWGLAQRCPPHHAPTRLRPANQRLESLPEPHTRTAAEQLGAEPFAPPSPFGAPDSWLTSDASGVSATHPRKVSCHLPQPDEPYVPPGSPHATWEAFTTAVLPKGSGGGREMEPQSLPPQICHPHRLGLGTPVLSGAR